jgi:hypothetical protein
LALSKVLNVHYQQVAPAINILPAFKFFRLLNGSKGAMKGAPLYLPDNLHLKILLPIPLFTAGGGKGL